MTSDKEAARRSAEEAFAEMDEIGRKAEESQYIQLRKLTDIDRPENAGKLVKVKAVLASNSVSYNVPLELHVECVVRSEDHKCQREAKIRLSADQMARYADYAHRDNLSKEFAEWSFKSAADEHEGYCRLRIKESITTTLYKFRIRPAITSLIFRKGKWLDEENDTEYKGYDVYYAADTNEKKRAASQLLSSDGIEPGSVYQIYGQVIADPKSQKVTSMAFRLIKDQTSSYDIDRLRQLVDFFEKKGLHTAEDRMGWFIEHFQRRAHIVKRDNLVAAYTLAFFSPTYLEFAGKTNQRGWLLVAAIGDSTTAKSETGKEMIRLLGGGQYITAETASMVGLSAAAVQTANGNWFIEFGPLVLEDMRLMVVDAAQKLSKKEWASMAESERTGVVDLNKAAKGQANARTRQIKIANPVSSDSGFEKTTKEMSGFLYPYLTLPTIMDIQSIARLDLCVFINREDVSANELNKPIEISEEDDPYLDYFKDLREFVWREAYAKNPIQGLNDEDFINAVHEKANALYEKFNLGAVPLVAIDVKFKLVRLAISAALATCSFTKEFDALVVNEDHLNYVYGLMDNIYTAAGLDKDAKREREQGQITEEYINTVIIKMLGIEKLSTVMPDGQVVFQTNEEKQEIQEKMEKYKKILGWMAREQPSFNTQSLSKTHDLTVHKETKTVIAVLQSEGIITSGRRGFTMTPKGNRLVKAIQGED